MIDEAQARAIFERLAEVHHSQDPTRLPAVVTEDVVYDDDGLPEPARGRAQLEAFFGGVWRAFPDFRLELIQGPFLSPDADGFALLGEVRGTMQGPLVPPGLAPTGGAIATSFAGFYQVDDGLIRRARIVIDTYELATQLGASPEPDSVGERLVVASQRLRARRLRRRNRRP